MDDTFRSSDLNLQCEGWQQGLTLFRQGKLSQARRLWEQAIETVDDPKMCYALGELCLYQFDVKGAARYFSLSLTLKQRGSTSREAGTADPNLSAA